MNVKHLWYIIPLAIIIGLIIGLIGLVAFNVTLQTNYPSIACIMEFEASGLAVGLTTDLFLEEKSVHQYIERRCAETTINFNTTIKVKE